MIWKRGLGTVAFDLDRTLYKGSDLTLWAGAIIAGLLLLFCSEFVHIDDFTVPGKLAENLDVKDLEKQVGIWSALNWSAVYLASFPCSWSARPARQARSGP
jgi:hypothetical protein